MTQPKPLTKAQKAFIWNCIAKKRRGFIAYGLTKRTALSLARKNLIKLAPHNIVFWSGEKVRPWMVTAKGYHAYFGTIEP